jgi:oxygen-independent coproporphyrinogen-3 oxidase
VTVECNPTSFDQDHARALVSEGVTRVSLGVQGLNSERLAFLGRLHDPDSALRAVYDALAAEVPRVSADPIYGVYKQSPEHAVSDVARVAETGVGHLSAYALTIEPGTRFGALAARGQLPLLDDAQIAESFEAVSLGLRKLGFRHYEISNFSKPGKESQHNLGYWLGRDYWGVGSGAYGTVTRHDGKRLRYRNVLAPEKYLEIWTSADLPQRPFDEALADREELAPAVSLQEAILLGLRTEEGIDVDDFQQRRGPVELSKDQARGIGRLLDQGRLTRTGARLTIPRVHWLFADAIIRDLL